MRDEEGEEDPVLINIRSVLLILFPASLGHNHDHRKSATGKVPLYFSPAFNPIRISNTVYKASAAVILTDAKWVSLFLLLPSGKMSLNIDPDVPTPRAGRKRLWLNPPGHESRERFLISHLEGNRPWIHEITGAAVLSSVKKNHYLGPWR